MEWNQFVKCNNCGSIFVFEGEDMQVFFNAEAEKTKRFVVCPECYEYIKIESTGEL